MKRAWSDTAANEYSLAAWVAYFKKFHPIVRDGIGDRATDIELLDAPSEVTHTIQDKNSWTGVWEHLKEGLRRREIVPVVAGEPPWEEDPLVFLRRLTSSPVFVGEGVGAPADVAERAAALLRVPGVRIRMR